MTAQAIGNLTETAAGSATHAPTVDAAAELKEAIDRIGDGAGYRFNATIEQALTPRPAPGMLGQQTQHVTLWLDGQRDSAEARFTVRIDGASVGQAAHFVTRDGQLFIQKDNALEPVQGGADSAMLPATRMSEFLRAAEGVTRLANEKRAGGISARYAFTLNMRVLSERLGADASRTALVSALSRISGSGEVWIDSATGIVQRQVVTLNIPGASSLYDANVKASIDLRDWTGVAHAPIDDAPMTKLPHAPATLPSQPANSVAHDASAWLSGAAQPAAAVAMLALIAICAVLAFRNYPRQAQRALTRRAVTHERRPDSRDASGLGRQGPGAQDWRDVEGADEVARVAEVHNQDLQLQRQA